MDISIFRLSMTRSIAIDPKCAFWFRLCMPGRLGYKLGAVMDHFRCHTSHHHQPLMVYHLCKYMQIIEAPPLIMLAPPTTAVAVRRHNGRCPLFAGGPHLPQVCPFPQPRCGRFCG